MDKKMQVMECYDNNAQQEWERLDRHPVEFALTLRFMERYINPSDSILDVSGGPGKYSIYFAKMGCDVTLVDLSQSNVDFALQKAKEENVVIKAFQGDACYVDEIVNGQYDHVFLMGALYHLQIKEERELAVSACLNLLKPDGIFYASFISNVAGITYALRGELTYINKPTDNDDDILYIDRFINDEDFTGIGFTHNFFVSPRNVLPFFKNFSLNKLHYFGQESMLPQAEQELIKLPQEVIDAWIDLGEKICEREDLLSHSEHLMYIGRKNDETKDL